MSGLFLTAFFGMGRIGVIEGLTINVLCVVREDPLKVLGEIGVAIIWHGGVQAAMIFRTAGFNSTIDLRAGKGVHGTVTP